MQDLIRNAHMLLGTLVGVALFARLILVGAQSPLVARKPLVLGFMAVDVLTFLFGVVLALQLPAVAVENGWLMAKVVAWFALFITVFSAMRFVRKTPLKMAMLVIGLAIYAYIMAVAHGKQPWPF